MSEIRLNLVDLHSVLAGTIHGSVGDACIAALTAEPETIAELEAALARYIKPNEDSSQFASFFARPEIDPKPHDAGLLIIDLAARAVAVESTYSNPGPEGEVHYHNGKHATEIPIRYMLDSEWLFVNSVESYRWSAERRRAARAARLEQTRIDTRAVLYGRPMLQFIVDFQNELTEKGFALPPQNRESAEVVADEIVKAHAAWLTMPRDDLGGRAPREVMLEKRRLIESDLDSRGWQWSMQGEGPPCLPVDSNAYRYGGFGTHEWVVYYDLMRHLFCMATLGRSASTDGMKSVPSAVADGSAQDKNAYESPNKSRTGSDSDLVSTFTTESCEPSHKSRTGSDSDLVSTFTTESCEPSHKSRTGSDSDLVSTFPSDTNESLHKSRTGSDSDLVSRFSNDTYDTPQPGAMRSVPSAVADGSLDGISDRIRIGSGSDLVSPLANDTYDPPQSTDVSHLALLDHAKSTWLESPQPNYDNRTPAVIIDNERRRLPITMTPEQLMIDEDCECCQMLARDAANGEPTFWHLDGCNMEDEFAFSWCLTIQEWEAEQRRREEWELDSARRDAERRDWDRQHLDQIMSESDPDLDPGDRRQFDPDNWDPLELNSHDMAELIQKMKRTHRLRSIRIADEDEDFQSPIKRNEPVN